MIIYLEDYLLFLLSDSSENQTTLFLNSTLSSLKSSNLKLSSLKLSSLICDII